MSAKIVPRSFGTHDGSFHADEVTACALLLLFDRIDRDKILRTREVAKLIPCEYVCDVGGIYNPAEKRFDHHQAEYSGEMSSAGMIWLYFKEEKIVDILTYDFFNRSLIWGVDAHDNGRGIQEAGVCTFSQLVAGFMPPQYDLPLEEQNRAFFEALDFVLGHLRRNLARYEYIRLCRSKVVEAMAKNQHYLYFETALPWLESFFDLGGEAHPALFVIMPMAGHWKLRAIPPSLAERMKVRCPLPLKWAGLQEKELKKESGIKGAIFCHKGRFISVWETKEDAFRAMEIAIKEKS